MLNAQRRTQILDRLEREGEVSVTLLSREWKVSEDTVRRDLRDLAEEGLVQRVHGGALRASAALGNYAAREELSTDVKSRLAAAASTLIRPGQVVSVDGGTSTLQLIKHWPRDLSCTVVTHSPLIAAQLRELARIEVIFVGGRIYRHSWVCVGSEASQAIGRIQADIFFLGATGIHPQAGATTGDWEEAAVKRAFCRSAAEVVLMASPEKLGAASAHQIVPTPELSTLVVDAETKDDVLAGFRSLGLTILKG